MAVRAARWSATHPWRAIVGWVVFVALCFGIGSMVGTNAVQGKDFWVGEAGAAEALLVDGDVPRPFVEKVLITSADEGPLDRRAGGRAAGELSDRMRSLPAVSDVGQPIWADDGTAVMVPVTMSVLGDSPAAKEQVPALLEQTAAVQAAHPDLKVAQTGDISRSVGLNRQTGGDLLTAEAITLPVTLAILFVVFGALLAAGIPVLLALTSFLAATGLYAFASHIFPDAGVSSVVLMMGMAVGVDYSLFYLKRVREERARSHGTLGREAAVELAAATSGHTILVSGFAVLVSLVGLYLADDVIFSSIATGSIIVVLVAMVSSLTVLPALLAKLGHRVDGRRKTWFGKGTGRFWPTLLRPAAKRPAATLAVGVLAMLALAVPALSIKLSVEGNDTFPQSVPEIAAFQRLTESFPAEGVVHTVVMETDPAHAPEAVRALENLSATAAGDPLFAKGADAEVRTSADGRISTVDLPIPFGANASEARESLDRLRGALAPAALGGVPSSGYFISGEVARAVDYVEHQSERTPWVVGFVLLLTFVMMVAAFRSVVMGLIGILLNMLSAAAAFGALVLVFQYLWDDLGMDSGGFITSRIPLILFVILFGLSMDYQIFVVSRIREGALRGLPTRQAIHDGITGSAGVVTSAAVVMVSVFISFTFVSLMEMKQIGFGLAVAVLLDAVVIRILILPSVMALLGDASWWPSRAEARARPAASGAVRGRAADAVDVR